MSNDTRIRDEVEKTLACMDNLEKLEAGPYFYTLVEARLREAVKKRRPFMESIGALAFKPVALTLIIVFNVLVTVLALQGPGEPAAAEQLNETKAVAAVFAADYSLTDESSPYEDYLPVEIENEGDKG